MRIFIYKNENIYLQIFIYKKYTKLKVTKI